MKEAKTGIWVAANCGPLEWLDNGVCNIADHGSGEDLIAECKFPTLSSETIDHIAIDSLRWHYKEGDDLEPLQREAFRIVLRYYGVSV
jgi:hypothetical protein